MRGFVEVQPMTSGHASSKRRIDSAADVLLVVLSSAIVTIALVAVFCRYALNHSRFWSDEVVRYLVVWFTFLGAAIALRNREHIRVEYFVELLPGRVRRFVEMRMLSGVLVFHLAMLVLGFLWVWETRGTSTSALKWPLNWFFCAAPPTSALGGAQNSLAQRSSSASTARRTFGSPLGRAGPGASHARDRRAYSRG